VRDHDENFEEFVEHIHIDSVTFKYKLITMVEIQFTVDNDQLMFRCQYMKKGEKLHYVYERYLCGKRINRHETAVYQAIFSLIWPYEDADIWIKDFMNTDLS